MTCHRARALLRRARAFLRKVWSFLRNALSVLSARDGKAPAGIAGIRRTPHRRNGKVLKTVGLQGMQLRRWKERHSQPGHGRVCTSRRPNARGGSLQACTVAGVCSTIKSQCLWPSSYACRDDAFTLYYCTSLPVQHCGGIDPAEGGRFAETPRGYRYHGRHPGSQVMRMMMVVTLSIDRLMPCKAAVV